jgi:hypothetical protein
MAFVWFPRAAIINGVVPLGEVELTGTPPSRSNWITLTWPLVAA